MVRELTTQQLSDLEEIRSLKAKYFRFVDTQEWPAFKRLFTPRATIDISEDVPGGVIVGGEAFAVMCEKALTGATTVHHGHTPEITLLSGTAASGIWAMRDSIVWRADAQGRARTLDGTGHYFEEYEVYDERWCIASLKLRRLTLIKTESLAAPGH